MERVASPPPTAAASQAAARGVTRSASSKSLPARVTSPAPVSSPTKPAPAQELFDLLSLGEPAAHAPQPSAAAAAAPSSAGGSSDWAAWGDVASTISAPSAEATESDPWDAFQGSELNVGSPASLPAGGTAIDIMPYFSRSRAA